jgi:signal transduction histidine kinase
VVDDQIEMYQNLDPADLGSTIKVLQNYRTREIPIKDGVLYGYRVNNISTIVLSETKLDDVERDIIALQTTWLSYLVELRDALFERDRLSKSLQKSNEFLQIQTIELRQALEAKATFLAHMSHEIRTPLNGILGAAQLLEATKLEEEQKELVGIQVESGTLLRKIIDSVLDLSKIEAGCFEVEREPFDIYQMLEQCVVGVTPLAQIKGLSIGFEANEMPPIWVKGDESRIRQSLLNLLSNAVKFSEEGVITVRGKRLEQNMYVIEVQDQGVGINPDDIDWLFSAFRQAKGQSQKVYGGTGLGLPLVRQYCRLHGGDAGAYCNAEQGSTFWMRLDLPSCSAPEGKPGVSEFVPCETAENMTFALSVLAVDDNAVNRVIVKKILQSLGCDVTLACDGQEAVALIQANPNYDFVLMDCMMPVMDGYDATRKIRSELKLTALPIYALTAAVTDEEQKKCHESGMDGIFFKPFKKEELVKIFQQKFST